MIGPDARGQSGLRYFCRSSGRLLGFAVLTSLFSAGFQLSQNLPGTILATPGTGKNIAGAVGSQVFRLGVGVRFELGCTGALHLRVQQYFPKQAGEYLNFIRFLEIVDGFRLTHSCEGSVSAVCR